MNTLLLLGLGIMSICSGFNLFRLKSLNSKKSFWTIALGFIIVSIIGFTSALPLGGVHSFQEIINHSFFGVEVFVVGLFVIVWGLPFFVNHKNNALIFTITILLLGFSFGAIYFAKDYLPVMAIATSYCLGIATKLISSKMIQKN